MEPACSPRVSPWAVSEAQIASTAQKELERGFRQKSKSRTFRCRERSRGLPDVLCTESGRHPEGGVANDGHDTNE